MEIFTVKNAIDIQQRQLKEWELLLKNEIFELLKNEVEKNNHIATRGNDILRGVYIDNILHNVVLKSLL